MFYCGHMSLAAEEVARDHAMDVPTSDKLRFLSVSSSALCSYLKCAVIDAILVCTIRRRKQSQDAILIDGDRIGKSNISTLFCCEA